MPDQLLNLLKVFLLLLLYLFFFRVLRAVWAEMSPIPRSDAAPPARKERAGRSRRPKGRNAPPHLAALAPPELAGRSFALDDEVTVGRAAGCHVTLDDSYASQLHARVFARDGTWYVEDLGSTNGTYLNRRKVAGPMVMSRGDKLQIGNTVLEMR